MARNSGKHERKDLIHIREVTPLNSIQGSYLNAIKSNSITFGIGSAGTGKTYIATTYAANLLFHKKITRIILTRPNVEVGRGLGFLPGDLEEKYAPYLEPFEELLVHSLGDGFVNYNIRHGNIQPKPLGFLRGATFNDAIVLADEMQNATKAEMKMLLSRIGEDCKIVISGDPEQCDIPNSGLMDAVNRLHNISGIRVVKFSEEDIVRSPMCKKIILAYKD